MFTILLLFIGYLLHESFTNRLFSSLILKITIDRTNANDNSNASSMQSAASGLCYGFTVTGYCPCQIGKVDKDSLAEQSGLAPGDMLIKINGKNVARATRDTIVKIIK
jgi:C-terminal processing protease CtpA/Prc